MEFVHRPYLPGQTIAAIATAPGEAGIAIVRISGADAIAIAEKVFSKPVSALNSHTVHYGKIIWQEELLDDVLLIVMKAPRSFTGEDTVEIQCHGGLTAKRVLEVVLLAGAKAASPGEFSFKAYMNGKMDLAQAEAIQAKIGAKNELALASAQEQLEGKLSAKVRHFQTLLVDIVAIFEAWVDFPEEGLEFRPFDEVVATLQRLLDDMAALIKSFHQGKILHDGVAVALVGSPNVGKSSLMNALLGKERVIVSPIAGTTRDLVEDDLRLNNLHLRLIDTAGIRETKELIEEEGIRRSKKSIERADVVLYVLDATSPDPVMFDLPTDKTIAIWNKIDMEHARPLPKLGFKEVVEVSALHSVGLEALHEAIDRLIWREGEMSRDEVVISSLRHKEALQEAHDACYQALQGLKSGVSPEFVSIDTRASLQALGTIIGTNITEDIITRVFSKFCIGK